MRVPKDHFQVKKAVDEELSYCPNLGNGQLAIEGALSELLLTLPNPQEKLKQPWAIVKSGKEWTTSNYVPGQSPTRAPGTVFPCRAASQAGENTNYAYCITYIERGPIIDSSGLLVYPDKITIRIASIYDRNTGELISQECTNMSKYSLIGYSLPMITTPQLFR